MLCIATSQENKKSFSSYHFKEMFHEIIYAHIIPVPRTEKKVRVVGFQLS
jgi:hypothetical protein